MVLIDEIIDDITKKCISTYYRQTYQRERSEIFLRILEGDVVCINIDEKTGALQWNINSNDELLYLACYRYDAVNDVYIKNNKFVWKIPPIIECAEDILSIITYISPPKTGKIVDLMIEKELDITKLTPKSMIRMIKEQDYELYVQAKKFIILEYFDKVKKALGKHMVRLVYR